MKTLKVYHEDSLVGILSRTEDLTYAFEYEESWRQNERAFPLSLAMPLSTKQYGNKLTLSFFENLLPEGEVRESLQRQQGVQEPFEFLKKFGQDCAGAIIITDAMNYKYSLAAAKLEPLEMTKIFEAIRNHESVAEVIAESGAGYLSLAGAQDKFPAVYTNQRFYIPTHGAATTHIVKVPIWRSGVKESVYNEYYCMTLARTLGFRIPPCQVVEGESPLFVIERYDRYHDTRGNTRRIHQQDFCQAQGLTSESKYEEKGGPSLKRNFDLIQKHVTIKKRAESMSSFMDWVCFNLLIGNNDSHSKNISLLYQEGRVELAPFYDLLCIALYPRLKKNFSFKIGDRDYFDQIGKNQFERLEDEVGVKRGTWLEHLRSVDEKVMALKDQVAHEVLKSHPSTKIVSRISDLIGQRSKGLRSQGAI
jgi:serine/threonine-protein kinase HipA